MIEQIGVALPFTAFFSTLGLGTTSLTVTVDVYRNGTQIVTGASATEVGGGLYTYTLASGSNNAEGIYVAVFKTATVTVDQQHLVGAWYVGKAGVEYLDASIAAVKAKTDNLPTDPADESLLEAAIAAMEIPVHLAVSEADALTVASGELSITSYAQFTQSVSSTTTVDLSAATKVWLAIKDKKSDADASSLVFVEKTAGLTVLAKAAYATPTDGSLSVTGVSGAWNIALTLKAAASALLHELAGSGKVAEIKALVGGEVLIIWSGEATLHQGVIRTMA